MTGSERGAAIRVALLLGAGAVLAYGLLFQRFSAAGPLGSKES